MWRPRRILAALGGLLLFAGCANEPPTAVDYSAAGGVPPAQRVPPASESAAPANDYANLPPAQRPPPGAMLAERTPAMQRRRPKTIAPSGSADAVGMVRVGAGDTVYSVAQREKVPVRAVIDANNLKPPYDLLAGRMIVVPRPTYYTVQHGETLYGISRRFGIDIYTLAQANHILPPYRIDAGRRLRIARDSDLPPTPATEVAQAAAPAPPVAAPQAAPTVASPATSASPALPSGHRAVVPAPPPRTGRTFAWPVHGQMISAYGAKPGGLHNDGINIAVRRGTEVHAAENGVVVYAGNELRGYGKLLLIRHADGWMTAYAHNEELLVHRGETVRRGQVIARSGASGSVAKPQLHFEIRHGVQAVDPVPYLSPSV
ncbi:MAG TPA: peptidoglycan DD-metalloendopeptidase family protein [Candidatus Sulfotelmatobacter sp.]|nr:peptidoglycan DD-metalloendopeptidase family protein [Candidatus Sulfotelmatobacter sp.]